MMNYFHLFFLSVFFLNFSGTPSNTATAKFTPEETSPVERIENDEFIPWMFERKLSWDDFSGPAKTNTEAVASTSTSLGIAYQLERTGLNYHITCNFSKHKSWGVLKTDYILAHEQGHFDITEIAARRLHQAISEYQFNHKTYRKDINEIYDRVVKEKEDMQAAYDKESDHSRNRRSQYVWLDKIDFMLEQTLPWAEYP